MLLLLAESGCTHAVWHTTTRVTARRTTGEKFNREYAYNIRYNYAQVRLAQRGQDLINCDALPQTRRQHTSCSHAYTHTHTHTHTQEGKRTEWSEWSCVRIIQKEVGPCAAPGDCNGGCPFKTLDEPKLRALLGRMTCGEK